LGKTILSIFEYYLNRIIRMQEIILFILFIGAVGYIGRLFYKSIFIKNKREASCENCPENLAPGEKPAKK
jgi:hypothetical protein